MKQCFWLVAHHFYLRWVFYIFSQFSLILARLGFHTSKPPVVTGSGSPTDEMFYLFIKSYLLYGLHPQTWEVCAFAVLWFFRLWDAFKKKNNKKTHHQSQISTAEVMRFVWKQETMKHLKCFHKKNEVCEHVEAESATKKLGQVARPLQKSGWLIQMLAKQQALDIKAAFRGKDSKLNS